MTTLTGDDARNLASHVALLGLEHIGADSLAEAHCFALDQCYITPNSHFEFVVAFSRGWDTDITISLQSNAEDSADRYTDRAIDVIRTVARSYINDNVDGESITEEEFIQRLNITRFPEKGGDRAYDENYSYRVEYELDSHTENIITDDKLMGAPRIAGRRLIVRDIWIAHVLEGIDVKDIPGEFDNVISEKDAMAAIEYAESSEDFKSRQELKDSQSKSIEEFRSDLRQN